MIDDIYEGYDDESPDSFNVKTFGALPDVPNLPPMNGVHGKLVKTLESGAGLFTKMEGEYPWSSSVVVTEVKDGEIVSQKDFPTEINPRGELEVDYYVRTRE